MKKFLITLLLAVLTSCYFFSFSVTFLPSQLNVKMIMAGVGVLIFAIKCIRDHSVVISREIVISGLLAIIFSVWCLFSITENGTDDTTYVEYWISFFTWMFGAYALTTAYRQYHEKVDLALATRYLAIVAVAQCVIALLIDNIPFIHNLVNVIFDMGQDFYERGGRLYGIGCALDPAGVRFSVILVLIAHQIASTPAVVENKRSLITYLTAFVITTTIGSIISRTTIVGTGLGLFEILISFIAIRRGGYISTRQIRMYSTFILVISALSVLGIYLYNTSPQFHGYLRFGFEGFFSLAEKGEFQTGSTDVLQTMWVWPTDPKGWMIGYGKYGVYVWRSDIGYCLFTLYCGLIGLAIYSIYYIYNHLAIQKKFRRGWMLSLLLIAVTFIVWSKVATDIFLINAILFLLDPDEEEETSLTEA